ncbi:hypothetical protein ES705_20872 [subsurface metagenome]
MICEIFKVNELITLKFENDRTNIYVAGKLFKPCVVPTSNLSNFDSIHSIDEIEDYISPKEIEIYYNPRDISSEEEFRAHCSNIAIWAENDYNTELLHRYVAFPLLKQLLKVGDVKAKKIFKEEIAYRYTKGNDLVKRYLRIEGYLDYLTRKEFFNLFPFGSELMEIENELNGKFVLADENHTKKKTLYFFHLDDDSYQCSKGAILVGICNYRLSKSKWDRILNTLSSIKQLEILDLSSNNLKRVPESIFDLNHLKRLNLSYNKIKKITQELNAKVFLNKKRKKRLIYYERLIYFLKYKYKDRIRKNT